MNENPVISEHSASHESQESVTSIQSSRRRFLRTAAAVAVVSATDRLRASATLHPPNVLILTTGQQFAIKLAGHPLHHKVVEQHRHMLAEWCAKFDTRWQKHSRETRNFLGALDDKFCMKFLAESWMDRQIHGVL